LGRLPALACGLHMRDTGRSAENLCSSLHGVAPGVSNAARQPSRCWRDATQHAIRQVVLDLVESFARVASATRMPSRKGFLDFFGSQLLGNAVGWTAGVMAAGFVETYFEAKSIRNLWGLAAWGDRTVVSANDYRVIMTLTSYTAGLVMLILMRHLVLRLATEFRDVRGERNERERASVSP
jgi:hypothetical protein